ncbi:MAG TPA: hypothetical protein VEP67_07030 [Thiobacillaceae bacterium]|nr:hypothetical protein [Thiobacillaceae bacterium]
MERTVKSVKPNLSNAPILVVRREVDHAASTIPGSSWENPEKIGEWITERVIEAWKAAGGRLAAR